LFRTTGAVVLPTRVCVRLMSTSEDITHSWAVPGLGIKVDCVPGRLFCIMTNIWREGVYFGQCSELCGWNHYNMPISVYALGLNHFILWWELELHSAFGDIFLRRNKIKSKSCLINLYFIHNKRECNYLLLNWKFK
jgi:heme/copper-type cytochrome/quinol oxidase subunit 2